MFIAYNYKYGTANTYGTYLQGSFSRAFDYDDLNLKFSISPDCFISVDLFDQDSDPLCHDLQAYTYKHEEKTYQKENSIKGRHWRLSLPRVREEFEIVSNENKFKVSNPKKNIQILVLNQHFQAILPKVSILTFLFTSKIDNTISSFKLCPLKFLSPFILYISISLRYT